MKRHPSAPAPAAIGPQGVDLHTLGRLSAPSVAVTTETVSDPRIGSVIAGHRIERLVGRGGMGVVYEAVDESRSTARWRSS